jgi:hypothetical protein
MLSVAALLLAANTSAVNAPEIEAAKVPLSFVKSSTPHGASRGPKGQGGLHSNFNRNAGGVPGIDSLTNFTSQFTAAGFDPVGNPNSVWPYEMVGRAPERNERTELHTPIIPVILDLLDSSGNVATYNGVPLTFDPTAKVTAVLRSPLFQKFQYFSGNTQFTDGLMRAEFWDRIRHEGDGDDGYHVIMNPDVKETLRMQIPFGAWEFFVDANGNPEGAIVDPNTFSNLLFPPTFPVDNSTVIGAAELSGAMTTRDLSVLFFNNVYLGNSGGCCVIGFHSYDLEPGDATNGNLPRRYVMAYASWIDSGLFLGGFEDITAISHELSETFNDPFVDDVTPWWLSVDPSGAFGGNCQDNLETGDVVEVMVTNLAVFPIQMNGFTYHPQNEAMFPWFAFESPSPARKGAYSFPDNTTLLGLSPGPLHPGCVP